MDNRLLSVEETAKYLGISINTLYAWVNQRRIPYVKLGRLVKFDPDKISMWLKEQTVRPYEFD